jgi:chromosome segregation ATPase
MTVGNQVLNEWRKKDLLRLEELMRQRAFGFYQLEQIDDVKEKVATEINDHRKKFAAQWEKNQGFDSCLQQIHAWLQQLTQRDQQKEETIKQLMATMGTQSQQIGQLNETLTSTRTALEKIYLKAANAEEVAEGATAQIANLQSEITVLQTAPEGFLQQKADLEAELGAIKNAMGQMAPEIAGDLSHRLNQVEGIVERMALSSSQNLQALHEEFGRTVDGALVQMQMHADDVRSKVQERLAEVENDAIRHASHTLEKAAEAVGQQFLAEAKATAKVCLEQLSNKIQGKLGGVPRDPPSPL